jgi:LemA protein
MDPIVIIAVILVVVLLWLAINYNGLVRIRQHVRESWSDIDTELKRRYDLIPNLVASVKAYAQHERELFDTITEARARALASTGSAGRQASDEKPLVDGMRRLFAVVESYPELKASDNFLKLQEELATTEDRIQRARRFYNGNVRELNTRVEVFPSNIVAAMFGFAQEEFFEVETSTVRQVVDVSFDQSPSG